MKNIILGFIVFICGAMVMVFEIVGSRVMGPYVGTSMFVWTSLIGIILMSLSLGYWIGGILSDKWPEQRLLAWIILLSAMSVLVSTLLKERVLSYLISHISDIRVNSVIGAIILFAPAGFLLGMVSPFAVRLKMKEITGSGKTVGSLYAISTVGSIAGTFAAGFWLIPSMGHKNVLFLICMILALCAMLLFISDKRISGSVAGTIFIAIATFFLITDLNKTYSYIDTDSSYNRIFIYETRDHDTGKNIKMLRINDERSSAIFTDSSGIVFKVLKYYHLAFHFIPDLKSTLMIGGSGYSFPMDFLKVHPEASIDVVEIDPKLTELAKTHFGLKSHPNLNIYHEDGRTFLNKNRKKYDVVFMDAYKSQLTIPYQLTTLEAVQRMSDALNENGLVMANIISSLDKNRNHFLVSELATYQSIFPQVILLAVNNPENQSILQNFMLIASKSNTSLNLETENAEFSEYLAKTVKTTFDVLPILTDDFAPVEYYANQLLH